MSDVPAASGRQHEVRHGDHVVTVVEVSGGVRAYTVGGADVLDGYGAGEMCVGARGQTLAPWPNRIADGAYTFEGESYQLPLTEPERRTAIHGLVRWANWIPEEEGDSRLTMSYRLHPSPGYPFTLDLRVHYELDDDGLTVRTVATNAGCATHVPS